MSVRPVWVALGRFGGTQARKELSTVAGVLARVLRCVASCAFSLAGDMMKVERDPVCVCLRADADVTDADAALAPRMHGSENGARNSSASFVRVTSASTQTEYMAPPPVTEYVAPAPSSSCAATAPVIKYVAPTPDVTHTAPAPVIEHVPPNFPETGEVVRLAPHGQVQPQTIEHLPRNFPETVDMVSFALHEQIQQQTVEHVPQNFPVTVETSSFTPVPDASSIPDVTHTALVPVIKHVSLAPDDTYAAPARLAPAPVTEHIAPARVAPSFCGFGESAIVYWFGESTIFTTCVEVSAPNFIMSLLSAPACQAYQEHFVVGETTQNIVGFHPVQEQVTVQEITEIQVIERIQGAG